MVKRTAQLFQEAKTAKITRDLQMFGFLKNSSPDLDEEWMNPQPAPADMEPRPLLDDSSTTVSDELAASETATAAAADAEHRAEQSADAATAGDTAAAEAAIQKLQRDFEDASAAGAAALPKAIDAQNAMKVVPLPPSRSLSSPPSPCALSISLSVPQPISGEQTRRLGRDETCRRSVTGVRTGIDSERAPVKVDEGCGSARSTPTVTNLRRSPPCRRPGSAPLVFLLLLAPTISPSSGKRCRLCSQHVFFLDSRAPTCELSPTTHKGHLHITY